MTSVVFVMKRQSSNSWGIVSTLTKDSDIVFTTLEHAYQNPDKSYSPKIPHGTYTCVRGMHQLAHMAHPFETFEITGIVGHTNILFHVGNFNADSEGCVLLGQGLGNQMIIGSKVAFDTFMASLSGVDSFTLEVL